MTALKPEMAEALRKADIESQVPALKAALEAVRDTEQAGKSEAAVSTFWAWIMGLGVVFIATFGAVIFAKVEAASDRIPEHASLPVIPKTPKPVPGTLPKGRGGRKADPKILNFTEAFQRAHSRRPSGSEILTYFPELPTSTAYDYARRV